MYDQGRSSLNETNVRRRRVALAASLLLHVLVAFLVARTLPIFNRTKPEPKEVVEVRQVLRLEKPTPEPSKVPAAASTVPIRRPVPVVASVPQPPVPRKLELGKPHFKIHLPPAPLIAPRPARPAATGKPILSEQRLAQIQGNLASAIAQDRAGIDPLHVPQGAAPDVKHYGPDFADLGTSSMRHHGLCDPIQSWKDGGWNYYYVACNVRFSDGSSQRQGVPWPVRFSPNDDPFAGTAHDERALALPLPGWHLPPNETITVELREYAHEHGVDI
jgi:hypothetical protein